MNATTGADPGAWALDARFSIEYVFLATNFTRVEDATGGLVVLPDESVRLDVRGVVVRHRALYVIADALAMAPANPASDYADVHYSPQAVAIDYWGPDTRDLASGIAPRRQEFAFGGNVGDDEIGPVSDQGEATSDEEWAYPGMVLCPRVPAPACSAASQSAEQLAQSATPNVLYGFRVESLEAATSPDALEGRATDAASQATLEHATFLADASPALAIPLARDDGPAAVPLPSDPSREDSPREEAAARGRAPPSVAVAGAERPASPSRPPLPAAARAAAAGAAIAVTALVLYRRILDRDLTSQPTRARLLALVAASPGIRAGEAAKRLGVAPFAVTYHARRLARAGAIVVRAHAGRTTLFLPGREPLADAAARAVALDHPIARAMLAHVAREGGASRAELVAAATASGARMRTAQWHLARLLARGVLAEDALDRRRVVAHRALHVPGAAGVPALASDAA